MDVRKLGIALGTGVLLLGMPTSYALAGPGGNGKPDKAPHECEDGIDNDGDGAADFGADADCGSERDNSEAPEAPEEPGGGTPGGELPALPPELQAVVDEVAGALGGEEDPGEEEPPGGEEPPAEEPGVPAEVQAVIDELIGGGAPPAPPVDPAEVEKAVADLLAQVPPPPA